MKSEAMIRLYLHNIFILFGINKYVIAKYLINKEFPLLQSSVSLQNTSQNAICKMNEND